MIAIESNDIETRPGQADCKLDRFGEKVLTGQTNGRFVAIRTEPCYHTHSNVGNVGMMTKWFSFVYVGNVDLDHRHLNTTDGIPNSHRSMSEGAWVHDENGRVCTAQHGMDPIDDLTFVVRLKGFEVKTQFGADGLTLRDHVG